jgi:hypothetical protein
MEAFAERHLGPVLAEANAAGNTLSLGALDHVAAAVDSTLSSRTYDQALAERRATNDRLATQNPVSNAAGTVAGMFAGGGVLAKALPAGLRAVEGASALSNAARTAAVGGGVAGTDAALHGAPLSGVATAAATGAVLGPLVGKAVEGAAELGARYAAPPLSRAWQFVAKKTGMDTAALRQWLTNYKTTTGRDASVAEALQSHTTGDMQSIAQRNPVLTDALQTYQDQVMGGLPGRASASVAQAMSGMDRPEFLRPLQPRDMTPNSVNTTLRASAKSAFDAIRDQPIQLSEELRDTPELIRAMGGSKWLGLRGRLHDNELTLNDVDDIRRALNKQSPHPGSDLSMLSDSVVDEAASQSPAYTTILNKFGQAARFEQGFNHGIGGGTVESASNKAVIRAVNTPEGAQGLRAGTLARARDLAASSPRAAAQLARDLASSTDTQRNVTRSISPAKGTRLVNQAAAVDEAGRNLDAITPSRVGPTPEGRPIQGVGQVGEAAIHAAAGNPHGVGYRLLGAMRALKTSGVFPPAVQRQLGTQLTSTNPAIQAQALDTVDRFLAARKGRSVLAPVGAAATGALIGASMQPAAPDTETSGVSFYAP